MQRWIPVAGLSGLAVLTGLAAFPEAASAHPVQPESRSQRSAAARPAAGSAAKPVPTKPAAKPADSKKPTTGTGTGTAKTAICHRSTSTTNTFTRILVPNSSLPAHQRHGDLVPAPAGGCPTGGGVRPVQSKGRTTICHRNASTKSQFVKITVPNSALPAHRRHGDIVPAPPGPCVGQPAGSVPPKVLSSSLTRSTPQRSSSAVRAGQGQTPAATKAQVVVRAKPTARANASAATLPVTGIDSTTGTMAALILVTIGTALTRVGARRRAS